VAKIPKGWIETTLGEVTEIKMGQSPDGETYNLNGNGLPFYQGIIEFDEKYVKIKTYTSEPIKIIEPNTILFSVRAPVGKVNFTKHKACIGRGNAGLTMNNGNQEFLFYLLKFIERQIQNRSSGTVFDSISGKELREIPIITPSNSTEQKAIASVLSALDDKIELLREQNQTLEEIAQTIFQEWFGKYKVGDKLPEGWRVGKVQNIVNIFDSQRIPLSSNQRIEKQGAYPYYGATSIMDYVDDYLFDGIYLLLAEDGSVMDQNGYPVLQYVWGQFWVNNHAHVLTGNNEFSTEILYLLFRKTKIAGIVNGAVQLKINQTNLMNFEIIIPPQETLKKFDEIIQPIFSKIRDNSEQIQTLARTRDELLPKLMTGDLRVDV